MIDQSPSPLRMPSLAHALPLAHALARCARIGDMPKTRRELDREVKKALGSRPVAPPQRVAGAAFLGSPVASDPGNARQRWFVKGFEFVRRDIVSGRTPDEAYDASSRTTRLDTPPAFSSGARAARHFYNGRLLLQKRASSSGMDAVTRARLDRDSAQELAREYDVQLPHSPLHMRSTRTR